LENIKSNNIVNSRTWYFCNKIYEPQKNYYGKLDSRFCYQCQ
jgi:hypothetical protein